ncbi:OmpA family protein [Acidocella sp.]|uniref:OmpA family protein n=1 Tax=Acidocella sp. TaxID=50710 RepID=UPI003D00E0F9
MSQTPSSPRKKEEKPPNHERWVISYADLLTLLLATFVVLYASSTRNKQKEDELTRAFIEAFHGTPPSVMAPQPSGSRGVLKHQLSPVPTPPKQPPTAKTKLSQSMARQLSKDMETLRQLNMKLNSLFQPMIDKHEVTITNAPMTLTIQLDASVLFDSGEATLKPDAASLLAQVGAGLTQLPPQYRVTVQGFTDNQPISTARFPSNWSLSAERAVAVVQLFIANGVDGHELAAEGFGEFSPVADNSTPAGRAQNRRVVVVVHAPDPESDDNAPPAPPSSPSPTLQQGAATLGHQEGASPPSAPEPTAPPEQPGHVSPPHPGDNAALEHPKG